MITESSSYKKTVKSTAVFGGAQLVQMVITVVRAKSIAVILGSHGMGINAIFQSTMAIISSFSSFGIFQSAVRDISQAFESKEKQKLSKTVVVFERMVWGTGILGLLICLACCAWLSKLAFENYDYKWQFALLSLGIFFNALSSGKTVFLEGTRNLSYLAKASMFGAALSLVIGIPLFYYCGITGIILSMVFGSLILYLTQFYYTRKIKLESIQSITVGETIKEGTPIIKLGSVLMIGMVVLTGFTYLTNIFIGRYGKIEDVGLFQGVSSINTQSIAIVIAVLASDFFPRLSAVFHDRLKAKIMINQQAELVSIIIAPILIILISFAPLIVRILLAKEFLVVVPMLRLMAMSLLARGIWLIMSYTILAHGDRKAYFIYDSLVGNGLLFLFNIAAYKYWGLQGLGISFFAGSIVISFLLFLMVKIKYKFNFENGVLKLLSLLMLLAVCAYINTCFITGWVQYSISGVAVSLTCGYCFFILNSRVGIIQRIRSKK